MTRFHSVRYTRTALVAVLVLAASVLAPAGTANALPPVGLGAATNFAIRAGSGVTNTGALTLITGDVGNSDTGAQITGLACANVIGTIFSDDGVGPAPCSVGNSGFMDTVKSDALAAFTSTSNLPGATPLGANLSLSSPLVSGLYSFPSAASNITTTLQLDAQNNPNAFWIFQASSDLITSTGSVVSIINEPAGSNLACNVFWTVQSSATIGGGSTFVGTILALASITVGSAAVVTGRLLANNQASAAGNVTLINDTITRPTGCANGGGGGDDDEGDEGDEGGGEGDEGGGGEGGTPTAGEETTAPPVGTATPPTAIVSPPALTG